MFSQVVVSSLLLAASVNGVMGIQYKREPNWFQPRDYQAQEVLTREQLNRVLPDLIPLYPSQVAGPSSSTYGELTPLVGTPTPAATLVRRSSRRRPMARMRRQPQSSDDSVDPNANPDASSSSVDSSSTPTPSDSASSSSTDSTLPTPTDLSSPSLVDPTLSPLANPSSDINATPTVSLASSSIASSSSSSVAAGAIVTSGPDPLDALLMSIFQGLPEGVKDGLSRLASAQMTPTGTPSSSGSASVSQPTPPVASPADGSLPSSASASDSVSVSTALSSALLDATPTPSSSLPGVDGSSATPSGSDVSSSVASDSASVPSATSVSGPDVGLDGDQVPLMRKRSYPPPVRRSVTPSASSSSSSSPTQSIRPSVRVNAAVGNQLVFSAPALKGLGAVMASILFGAMVAL